MGKIKNILNILGDTLWRNIPTAGDLEEILKGEGVDPETAKELVAACDEADTYAPDYDITNENKDVINKNKNENIGKIEKEEKVIEPNAEKMYAVGKQKQEEEREI